ncbi:MAG: peptidylprolyl isomerase [Planctomycetota bacterium]
MERTTALFALLLVPLSLLPSQPQDAPEEPQAPPAAAPSALPEGVAARIGQELITLDEYKDYLLWMYGAGPLDELILTRLLQREGERLGLRVTEEELDAEVETFWERYLMRFRGDQQLLQRELAAAGFTEESYRNKIREETRRNLLEARICRTTRELSEELLNQRFEQRYGKGGVRVEVRHVLFTRARTKANLRQRGLAEHELTLERIDAELKKSAVAALARLRAGEDFAAVAKTESHDVSVHQNQGVIPGYNYERYGPELAEAVRATEPGVVNGPVQTQAGLHLIEVMSRTTRTLDEVREELSAALMDEPASFQERNDLRRRLRNAVEIDTYR